MTDEYLKMVLALPDEFFDGWEWKEGDQFIRYNHEWKYIEIQGHVGNYSLYSYTGKICNINETGDYVEGDLRPVPSQEQLIKMIKDNQILKNVKLSDLEILERVTEWHVRRDPEKVQDKCVECLFLEVLMWLNDNIWDGKKWL